MDNRRGKLNGSEVKAQVIICDIHSEIDLDGSKLLKLEFGQPGPNVMCTAGALWLTQEGDPHDYILKAGQSFTLNQRGIVLVQGLPRGKALLLETPKEPLAIKSDCSSQWPDHRSLRTSPFNAACPPLAGK